MTPNVQLEVERKYEVPTGAEPDWSALPTLVVEPEVESRALEAVYFDTASDRLAGFGIALRRRKGGPDAGWHLKYRDELGKHELHVPLLKSSERMPAQMKQYVAGLAAGADLTPLATVRNDRAVLKVMHPDFGQVAEICIDDVVATAERTGVHRTWAEYEVELVNGTGADGEEVFAELETVLLTAGLTPSTSTAKIARALGAEDGAPAVTVIVPETADQSESPKKQGSAKKSKKSKKSDKDKGGKSKKSESAEKVESATQAEDSAETQVTAEDQVVALANQSLAQLLYADFLLRIGDPSGVHAVRVAARRLIAVIQGIGDELAGTNHPGLADQLSVLSDRLSAARDAEVVVELLPGRAAVVAENVSDAGLGQLKAMAQDHRESTRSAAVRHLNGRAHMQLLTELTSWAEGLQLTPEARELSAKKLATRAVKRWSQAVADAEASLQSESEPSAAETDAKSGTKKTSAAVNAVHAHRKALRNLRYGLEGLSVTAGLQPKKAWRGLLDNTQDTQAELSEMMDSAVMDDWFGLAARSLIRTGGDRYVVGLLHGQERARLQDYETRAPELIDRLLSEVSPDA
ncbi:CYTH and CHAD domain-containing protein [Kocuria sp. JC486]|uniref:CYTH and CHAD domain-containing protein n=1 Tax=Kocuria sp. JC486 TaxID=1970736 RepID=UPI00141DEB69|nr:CYTH and CHAD domain-containing protein [Kocuria sp. JC486]NHU86136.1 CYTH and CHAD domain-containing protein [Kocuria sp. JC486]